MVFVPHMTTMIVKPMASVAVRANSRKFTFPLARLLTSARIRRPSTSSITAAARMIRLARSCKRPLAARTCAVMPTLVATIAAPTKIDSICGSPQSRRMPHPRTKGTATPSTATQVAIGPTLIRSEAFTSSPTRNRRNITPSSASAVRKSLGAIQPSTLGPITTPARIWPTIPGWWKRSNSSSRILAEAKTTSMARGSFTASGPDARQQRDVVEDHGLSPPLSVHAKTQSRKENPCCLCALA